MSATSVVFYGDRQARALSQAFARGLEGYGIPVACEPSQPPLADALVFSQVGDGEARRHAGGFRFPVLRAAVLWPFRTLDPFVRAGRDADEVLLGNRVLQRCIDRGWDEERILAYYRASYDAYRVDLARMAALEDERALARDRSSDVKMADAVARARDRRSFWSAIHPLPELLETLAERSIVVAAKRLPPGLALAPDAFDEYAREVEPLAVPVDPGVARELGLAWCDTSAVEHDAYVRAFVRRNLEARRSVRDRGWMELADPDIAVPPIHGLRIVGPAAGLYRDGFTGPRAGFDIESEEASHGLIVEGYVPSHHDGPVTVRCALGETSVEKDVPAGHPFTMTLRTALDAGTRASFEIACSKTVNTFERGTGADWRDLGVLLISVRPRDPNARTAIFFGNCQAAALSAGLAIPFAAAAIETRFLASSTIVKAEGPALEPEDVANCDILFEQIDTGRFPYLDDLPASCRIVRFPSIGTSLLWPFAGINPFYPAQFPGNRILQRCIEAGWGVERILDHYLSSYDAFRVNLTRLAPLDSARVIARDAEADVQVGDIVGNVTARAAFYDISHPYGPLMVELGRRLVAAAGDRLPDGVELGEESFAASISDWEKHEVPIHPGVARDLGLAWYDAGRRYLRPDGSRLGHDDYVRALIRDMQKNLATRDHERISFSEGHGWHPPIEGAHIVGPAVGVYPDGLAESSVRFVLEADRELESLVVSLHYPAYHGRGGRIVCSLGERVVETTADPGAMLELEVPVRLRPGERAPFSLECSESFNLLESGRGVDARDLGLVLVGIRPSAMVPT